MIGFPQSRFDWLCDHAEKMLPELESMPKAEFMAWLRENKAMYGHWRAFAQAALRKGRTRFSAYMIRERVRWYVNVDYGGEYKISNNVTPYMARVLALDLPQLQEVFSFKQKGDTGEDQMEIPL